TNRRTGLGWFRASVHQCTPRQGTDRSPRPAVPARREQDMSGWLTVLVVLALVVLVGLALSVRIVQQYEKGVLFRLGRVVVVREPGPPLIVPPVEVPRGGGWG